MMTEFDFEAQRRKAVKHIREMKESSPYIFPQWQRLQQAKSALANAQQELEAAQRAWDAL